MRKPITALKCAARLGLVAFLAAAGIITVGRADPPAPNAGGWIYPSRDYRAPDGSWVYPTSDGRRFESAMDREAYLRESRDVRRRLRAAETDAARQQARAAEAERHSAPPMRSAPVFIRAPSQRDTPSDRLRLDRERDVARQQQRQQRLQRFLEAERRSGAAGIRSDLARERAERARRIAEGEDRLYGGAAAARRTLGERERRPIGPLIRMPSVGEK